MTIILAYLRLTSYAIVMLSSIMSIKTRKFNPLLFVGDIVLAFALVLGALANPLGNADGEVVRMFIVTPGVFVWAILHFCNLVGIKK